MAKEVTDKVSFQTPEIDCLSLDSCICGKRFNCWEFTCPIHPVHPDERLHTYSNCGRSFYFSIDIKVFEIPQNK